MTTDTDPETPTPDPDTPTPDPDTPTPAPEPELVTPDQPLQAVKLDKKFDGALLGATIQGQFAYSLVMLTELATEQLGLDVETAKSYVGHQAVVIVQAHGAMAPAFIDDTLVRGEPRQRGKAVFPGAAGKIIVPNSADVPKDIAVPGQNHGAVKGFIAPSDLGK